MRHLFGLTRNGPSLLRRLDVLVLDLVLQGDVLPIHLVEDVEVVHRKQVLSKVELLKVDLSLDCPDGKG